MSDLVCCEACGSEFVKNRATHRFCSSNCRHQHKRWSPAEAPEPIQGLAGEEWRPVHLREYAAFYEVSNMGRVRSNGGGSRPWRIMRPGIDRGYPMLHLRHAGKSQVATVHRLVLHAFIGPPPEGHECAHLNGVRDDCRLANLRDGSRRKRTPLTGSTTERSSTAKTTRKPSCQPMTCVRFEPSTRAISAVTR